ncbi:MAG: trypsin-like peptidase domain-containing protein [Planctomycetota bacterium]|nr:trypsin-like peptidase domain-containing protein [Planctomycetota bacterium]
MSHSYPPFSRAKSSALPLALAGGAFALAAYLVIDRVDLFAPAPSAAPRPVTARGALAPLEESFVAVFEQTAPSVAHINTQSLVADNWGSVRRQQGSGSGFVWDESGIVVTNDHVVRGARKVEVTIAGRNYSASVLRSSPSHDLAILQLQGSFGELVPIQLGTSRDLRVGQTAIAIGNPFGFDQTMTTGVVSALNRTLKGEDQNLMYGLIQVDAAINPGNSGGPLLDSAGRLIGVTTAIYSPSGANAGLGFAVPVDTVNEIVPRLLGKQSTRAVLGLTRGEYGSYRLGAELGLPYASGAIAQTVAAGYGAARAGMRPFAIRETRTGPDIERYGDVIVAIDGTPVRAFHEFDGVLSGRKPGDVVKVTAVRGLPDAPELVELEVELRAQGEQNDGR